MSTKIDGCNICKLYEGLLNIDPHIIKRQTFQQGEIYVIMKSLVICQDLINKACSTCSDCPENNNQYFNKLIVDSNQILALGYRNIQYNHSITLTIPNNVELACINGGTIIIFNENTIINNGILSIFNSNMCLESNNDAKFLNNGIVDFKNSQLFGTGMIINNKEFNLSSYSKLYLGRLKKNIKLQDNQIALADNEDECLYDFGQNSTKFINSGTLTISGYSLFDLLGYFINGVNDVSSCFYEDMYCSRKLITNGNQSTNQQISSVFVKTNSKFLFTLGSSSTDTFSNEFNGLMVCENNTYIRFKLDNSLQVKNLERKKIINKGIMVLNGEIYFMGVNVENYSIIKNTIHNINGYIRNGVTFGNQYNYSKMIFLNNNSEYIPSFKNIGNKSLFEISATSTLHIFGYNVMNQGIMAIGISRDNIGDISENRVVELEVVLDNNEEIILEEPKNRQLIDVIEDVTVNGEFIYGFAELNNDANIMFKNWGSLYIFFKSRFITGYNSSSVVNNKRQVIFLNYGLLRNWGYLKVCRFSEIVNLPSFPFNPDSLNYGIINGSNIRGDIINNESRFNFNLSAILIITRPIPGIDNNPFTGGFIKSENRIFSNTSSVVNLSSGVIVTWFGYVEDNEGECEVIYGISDTNVKAMNKGKIVPIAYPKDLNTWPKNCLSKFLEEQSLSFNFDFKIT